MIIDKKTNIKRIVTIKFMFKIYSGFIENFRAEDKQQILLWRIWTPTFSLSTNASGSPLNISLFLLFDSTKIEEIARKWRRWWRWYSHFNRSSLSVRLSFNTIIVCHLFFRLHNSEKNDFTISRSTASTLNIIHLSLSVVCLSMFTQLFLYNLFFNLHSSH